PAPISHTGNRVEDRPARRVAEADGDDPTVRELVAGAYVVAVRRVRHVERVADDAEPAPDVLRRRVGDQVEREARRLVARREVEGMKLPVGAYLVERVSALVDRPGGPELVGLVARGSICARPMRTA